jgi:TP901 family phage tail tape measure protein
MAMNNFGLGFLFTAKDMASGVMNRITTSFTDLEGGSSKAAKNIAGSFKAFGIGLGIMGAGIAGLAMLEPAIAASMELSKAVALVATEADESRFSQARMRDVSEQLASTFAKMPVDEAGALYKAVALGADDAAKSTAFLTGVNLLAVAGNADLKTSTDALGGAMNAYHMSFDKTTDVSDAFFTAMKRGNTTVQDLASSVGRVTSSAANLGVSIDEVLGAVSVMTNKGVAAAEAVSGLKEAFANVVHPSAEARAEAAKLGIKFTQAELRAKGLQGFLQEITSSSKYTADSMSKLFTSVEGVNAILQVVSNGGKDFAATMDAMKDKSGATQAGFEIMSDTLDFQKAKFEANKKVVLGMIGQALEPFARAGIKAMNSVMEAITRIPKPIIAVAAKIFLAASAFLAVVGALIAAKAAIAIFIIGMKAAGITLGAVLATLLPVIIAMGVLALAFYGFREAYERNLGGFRDLVDSVVSKVRLGFEALGQLFSQGGFSGAVREEIDKASNQGLKNFIVDVYVFVKRLQNLWGGLKTGFADGISAAKPAIDAFVLAIRRLGEAFGFLGEGESASKASATWKEYGDTGARVGKALAKVFEILLVVVTALVDVSRGVVKNWDLVEATWNNVKVSAGTLGGAIENLLQQLGMMTGGTSSAKNGWTDLGLVISIIVALITEFVAAGIGLVSMVVSIVSGVVGAVRSLLSGLMDMAYGAVAFIADIFQGNWAAAWKDFKLMAFGAIDAVVGILLELLGIIGGVVDAIAGMMGKRTGLQAALQDFKASAHNEVATELGIGQMTGMQQRAPQVAVVAPQVSPPIDHSPGNGAASPFGPPAPPSAEQIGAAIGGAMKNAPPPNISADLSLDGETLGKLKVKLKGGGGDAGGDAASFSPAPIPT